MKEFLARVILSIRCNYSRNRDGVRQAHRLYLSTRLPSNLSIDQSFQKMIDNSSIYPFLKGLIN